MMNSRLVIDMEEGGVGDIYSRGAQLERRVEKSASKRARRKRRAEKSDDLPSHQLSVAKLSAVKLPADCADSWTLLARTFNDVFDAPFSTRPLRRALLDSQWVNPYIK